MKERVSRRGSGVERRTEILWGKEEAPWEMQMERGKERVREVWRG